MTALYTGLIVLHAAMPAVLANFPERVQANVDGYVAVSDCSMVGQRLVLVRPGLTDALVVVADCAAAEDVAYRARVGYIADVETALWAGPERPLPAELWRPENRALWYERWRRATDGQ